MEKRDYDIHDEPIRLGAVVLECRDVVRLARFYSSLLGWEQTYSETDEWVDLTSTAGGVQIAFQKNEDYIPPVWPDKPGEQQQMAHLDFKVRGRDQMARAVEKALALGAMLAQEQYSELWTVLIDPEGHPFCLVTDY